MVLAKGLRVLSMDSFYEKVSAIPGDKERALIVMLYLTGARISEIVRELRKSDIHRVEGSIGKFLVIRIRVLKKYDIVEKIKIDEDHKKFITKGRIEYRNVPINIEKDRRFIQLARSWIKGKGKNDILFQFNRQFAWRIVRRYGFMPHYLRHLRLTHLVSERGFTDQDLVQFTGWADSKPAKIYTHLRWQDIARKV